MSTENPEIDQSFTSPSQAARLRDILHEMIRTEFSALTPTKMAGILLDVYQGGPTFNSTITVESTELPRTEDNPAQPFVARVRVDDKFGGEIIEARIDPNFIPVYRTAEFFDEENPAGSGVMVDRAGRYVTVETSEGISAPLEDAYPSLLGTTLLAPQVAPRLAVEGSAGAWVVTGLLRGVLATATLPPTLMSGPDYAIFDTTTLTWAGLITFIRGTTVNTYEILPGAPIITYGGGEELFVSGTEPVSIDLGTRTGSMYVNFATIDGVPALVWVEAGSGTPIPPEWYLIFARVNDGTISSKLIFSSQTDFRQPSAPANLEVSAVKTGYEKYDIIASWDLVTDGTNGDPIGVDFYELWGESGGILRRITSTQTNSVTTGPFDAGTDWNFSVVAVTPNGVHGIYSAIVAISLPEETDVLGGTKTYWQDTKPPEGNEGDEWFDIDDGNAHYIHNGVDYILAPFGGTAIALASIGEAHIMNASITDAKIVKLKASKIESDELKATITLSGMIQTAVSGKRVVINQSGVMLYDSSGTPITIISTDGTSTFYGNIEARGLNVYGTASFKAPKPGVPTEPHSIEAGAELVLKSGITAPGASPTASNIWDYDQLLDSEGGNLSPLSVCRLPDGTFLCATDLSTNPVVLTKHASDGSYAGSVNATNSYDLFGTNFVALGGYIYWLEAVGDDGSGGVFYQFKSIDYTTGVYAGSYGEFTTNWKSSSGTPLISTDGTSIVLTFDSTKIVKTYSVSRVDSTTVNILWVKNTTLPDIPYGPAVRGNFEIGIDSYAYPYSSGGQLLVKYVKYSDTSVQAAYSFPVAVGSNVRSFGYHSGEYWSASSDGKIYKYNGPNWSGAVTAPYDFAYTLYDSVGTTHESMASPRQVVSLKKRAKIRVSAPGWEPDDSGADTVNQLRYYAATSGGTLALQGATNTGFIDLTAIGAGAIPPASTNFPASTPGKIRNTDSTLVVSADGTVKGSINPDFPRAKMIKTANQTLTASTHTHVTFSSVVYDNASMADAASGTFTIPVGQAGTYKVGFLTFFSNAGSVIRRFARLEKNATTPNSGTELFRLDQESSGRWSNGFSIEEPLAAGDTIKLAVWAGAASAIQAAEYPSIFFIERVR